MNLNGLGVALTTPFNESLKIDFPSLENHLNYLLDSNLDYLVILGTTSESPTLLHSERVEVLNFVSDIVDKRVPLIIGVGGNATKSVIDDMNSYDHSKFESILSVCPYYNLPSQNGLFSHFKDIASESKLPIILYNVPSRTGCNLSPETVFKLSNYTKKIIGIKEANPDINQLKKIIELCSSDFQVISGDDATSHIAMKYGAVGSISVIGNAYPIEFKRILNISTNKNDNLSDNPLGNLKKIISLIFEEGNPTGIKCVMSKLGIYQNYLRLPLTPASKNLETKITKEVNILSSIK